MNKRSAVVVIVFLLVTIGFSFGLPKPRYESLDVIKTLAIPYQVGAWQGRDVQHDLQLMDDKYNFIKALFLREYRHPSGQRLYLYLLDAGNFHNPKVCLNSAGFTIKDMDDVRIQRPNGTGFNAQSIYIGRQGQGQLVTFWITINGERVDWLRQKASEFWFSLIGRKKAGLMVRIDSPVPEKILPLGVEGIQNFTSALGAALSESDRNFVLGK